MIRGVIFDCFGVLYGGSLSTLLNLCPPEKQQELRDLNKQDDYGYITFDQYVQGMSELIGVLPQEIVAIVRTKHIRNDQLIEFARDLSSGYRIALLSNVGNDTIERLFTPDELAHLFDTVVLSYREHITKPHPEIYRLAAERLGLGPEECVMIDDLVSNCDGAEAAGMHAILHTTNDNTRRDLAKLIASQS